MSDSWSVRPKGLGGVFTDSYGNWADYRTTDTDGTGRQYIDLWLVPDAVVEFKAILFDSAGGKKYETDFKTTSGRRTLKVPSVQTTVLMNWSDTPGAPSGLKAYTDSGRATLSWTANAEDSSLDVVQGGGYFIYYDTGPVFDTWVLVNAGDTLLRTTGTVTGLTNDSTYYFSVRAFDAYWDTGPVYSTFSESTPATPGSPANILFRIFVGGLVDSDVYLGYDTGGGWTERPLTKEGSTKWWSDTVPLYRGFDFSYKFVNKDTAGVKTFEFPVSSGRSHMFIFPNRSGLSTVNVKGGWDWGAATAMRKDADGYWRADVSITNGGTYEYGYEVNGSTWETDVYNPIVRNNNSLLAIDGTTNSGGMRRLVIPDTTGVTTVSADWEDTPYTPTGFKAMTNTSNSILLTWTTAALIEDLDSYRIEYSEIPSDSTGWVTLVIVNSDSTTYVHNNIIPGDTYYYRLYAIDHDSNSSDWKNFASTSATQQRDILILIRKDDDRRPAAEHQRRTEFARNSRKRK